MMRIGLQVSMLALVILPGYIIGYSQEHSECGSLSSAGVITDNTDWLPCQQSLNGTVMVFVPAGQFRMGSTQQEITAAHRMLAETYPLLDEANAEKMSFFDGELMPEHEVQHVSSFWIDKYEVSNAQFRQVCPGSSLCSSISVSTGR